LVRDTNREVAQLKRGDEVRIDAVFVDVEFHFREAASN
jgi:hypothetical protein